jgi:hypothetical protein
LTNLGADIQCIEELDDLLYFADLLKSAPSSAVELNCRKEVKISHNRNDYSREFFVNWEPIKFMEVSIMKIKMPNETNEAQIGNELKDPKSPLVYKEELEIIDDDNDDDANGENSYRATIENNSFTMFTAFFETGKTGFHSVD